MSRTSMNQGMTLIEVLIALSLLAVIMNATLSWTATASRTIGAVAEPLAWELAAEATLARIGEDLRVGDLGDLDIKKEPRVALIDGRLLVATRSRGENGGRAVTRAYRFDGEREELNVREGSKAALDAAPARVVLGRMRAWHTELGDDGVLHIELIATTGRTCARTFHVATAKKDGSDG